MKAETIYVQNGKNQIYGQMYKPDGDGKYPLLIYSHGYGYNYEEYDLQEIARHGIGQDTVLTSVADLLVQEVMAGQRICQ